MLVFFVIRIGIQKISKSRSLGLFFLVLLLAGKKTLCSRLFGLFVHLFADFQLHEFSAAYPRLFTGGIAITCACGTKVSDHPFADLFHEIFQPWFLDNFCLVALP
jgi:hypothetical protein